MKIAIFHDYFGAIGGGEKVVIEIAKILDADIITTDTDAVKKIDPSVRVISLGKTIKFPPLKQISATIRFFFCDFSNNYDLFIFTGNWSHAAAHRHHPNIWYCYTPVRAFYDLYPTFLSRQGFVTRQLFRTWVYVHRFFDQRSVQQVDQIIAISLNVKERILKYHNRHAEVIYPPVNTYLYRCIEYGNFWLSVNRLYPEKRIELQIDAFRQIPEENLVIVGGYSTGDHAAIYAEKIRHNLPPNVILRGEVTEDELIELYARCKAHICTALDEDYGLTPLEAMASGKPVVAVNEGGYRETITKDTGIFVKPDAESLAKAVRRISKNPVPYQDACIARAKEFDRIRFCELLKIAVIESNGENSIKS
jgi:glycosyltransferase involved in cell wall biosynthesis